MRSGSGSPGAAAAGVRRRSSAAAMKGPVDSEVAAVMQENFGCAVANRFYQLLDDESDPFDILREAERRQQQRKKRDEAAAARRAGPGGRAGGGGGGGKRESQKERKQLGNPSVAGGPPQPGTPAAPPRRGEARRAGAAAGSGRPGQAALLRREVPAARGRCGRPGARGAARVGAGSGSGLALRLLAAVVRRAGACREQGHSGAEKTPVYRPFFGVVNAYAKVPGEKPVASGALLRVGRRWARCRRGLAELCQPAREASAGTRAFGRVNENFGNSRGRQLGARYSSAAASPVFLLV